MRNLFRPAARRPWRAIALTALAAFIPLLLICYLIHKYAVAVPFLDEWDLVSLMQAYHSHHLTFGLFWAQHNEHRIIFPRLAFLLLAILSHWNIMLEMIASVVIATATVALALWLLIKTFGRNAYFVMLGLLTPWIMFSPVQWENWLWGFQLAWFMMLLATVITIWVLTVPPRWLTGGWRPLIIAITTATIATYSLGSGILIWPVVLGLLLLQRRPRLHIMVWVAAAIPLAGAYFIGYQAPATAYPATLILHDPMGFAHHFLTLIGRPLGYDIISSTTIGTALLLTFIASVWYLASRRQLDTALPWVGLGSFTLLSSALTSFSRFGAGVNQAMSSRYYAITCLFLLSTLVLSFLATRHYRATMQFPSLLGPLAATIIIGSLVFNNYFYGVELMGIEHTTQQTAYDCTHAAKTGREDCLTTAFPDKKYVWPRIQFLRNVHWGGF